MGVAARPLCVCDFQPHRAPPHSPASSRPQTTACNLHHARPRSPSPREARARPVSAARCGRHRTAATGLASASKHPAGQAPSAGGSVCGGGWCSSSGGGLTPAPPLLRPQRQPAMANVWDHDAFCEQSLLNLVRPGLAWGSGGPHGGRCVRRHPPSPPRPRCCAATFTVGRPRCLTFHEPCRQVDGGWMGGGRGRRATTRNAPVPTGGPSPCPLRRPSTS